MRFRLLQLGDLPEVVRLYGEYLDGREPTETPYPNNDDPETLEEFNVSVARQLLANPHWFCIAGVVGSKYQTDAAGVKQVLGGKVKAFIMVQMSERTVGKPKHMAFIELLVVDPRLRKRDVGRKLVHLMAFEAQRRGAEVIELAYSPGSLGAKMWPTYGAVPYRILAAYIDPDGTPRQDLPMPKINHTPAIEVGEAA